MNPADPEATFRRKAGKKHIGYVGNITETVGENESLSSSLMKPEKNCLNVLITRNHTVLSMIS